MIVYSLSGPSGTGKSTSALQFAHEHNIEAIIDDGLLIISGEKKAGTSAKFEKNTVTAIRRAIFQDEDHKEEVLEALKTNQVQSLLIIGTSDKMTKKIAERLQIGSISHFYHVEDVRSKREIQMAQFVRGTQGKHVMPIPYKQVEQNFFMRLIHKGFDIFSKNKVKLGETTIVRPDFHRQVIDISRNVYIDLIKHTVRGYREVAKVDSVQFGMKQYSPKILVSIYLQAPVNYQVIDMVTEIQKSISNQFITHFEFQPGHIQILVKGII